MSRRREPPTLDVDQLPADLRTVIAAAIDGAEVTVVRESREIGYLAFHSSVLEGGTLPSPVLAAQEVPAPHGATGGAEGVGRPDRARRLRPAG